MFASLKEISFRYAKSKWICQAQQMGKCLLSNLLTYLGWSYRGWPLGTWRGILMVFWSTPPAYSTPPSAPSPAPSSSFSTSSYSVLQPGPGTRHLHNQPLHLPPHRHPLQASQLALKVCWNQFSSRAFSTIFPSTSTAQSSVSTSSSASTD